MAGWIHHSDRGFEYASDEYRRELRRHVLAKHEQKGRLLGQRCGGELFRIRQRRVPRPTPAVHPHPG